MGTSRRAVYDYLLEQIQTGAFKPGGALPSERELAEGFGMSRGTVREALQALEQAGLVRILHGKGAFVLDTRPIVRFAHRDELPGRLVYSLEAFYQEIRDAGMEPSSEPSVGFQLANAEDAEVLGIGVGDPLCVRKRLTRADGVVVHFAEYRLPRSLTAGTRIEEPEPGHGGIYAILEAIQGIGELRFVDQIQARRATEDEASLLEMRVGAPVLATTRRAISVTAGRVVEYNRHIMDADRWRINYGQP
jgi:GntR family transcriptional regulator